MSQLPTPSTTSKTSTLSGNFKDGYASGKQWALISADYAQLDRVEKLHRTWEHQACSWTDGGSCWTNAEFLAITILGMPENDVDQWAIDIFWADCDEAQLTNDGFLHGFVSGAMEIAQRVGAAA